MHLENVRLRDELRASLYAVTESREQVAALQSTLGASAAEREILARLLDETVLPRVVLESRIKIHDLELEHVLGQGCFGQVHLARIRGCTRVACKTLLRSRLTEQHLRTAIRSAELLLSIRPHPNIVKLLGVAWSIESARMVHVMELCGGGTLAAALARSAVGETELGWCTHKLGIAVGVAQGLAHLHGLSPPIVHRDIKPENILLADDMRSAKIADLGLCHQVSSDGTDPWAGIGTPVFAAPESLKHDLHSRGACSTCTDIWSFGCVLACMEGDRSLPYDLAAVDDATFLSKVAMGCVRPEVPPHSIVYSITGGCCEFDAERRPCAEELVSQLLDRRETACGVQK